LTTIVIDPEPRIEGHLGNEHDTSEVFIPNSCTRVAYGEPIARLDPRALRTTRETRA
jgi:hypothetical protein